MSSTEQIYSCAREMYLEMGVDTELALERLKSTPISFNCWQLDDLTGFENFSAKLTGGIQATGNAPGKPRSVEEYVEHLNRAMSYIPGAVKLALHSVYSVSDKPVDRSDVRPEHFRFWVDYAKDKKIGLDFNPTYFSHPMADSGLTLTSPNNEVREYWIRHGIACRKVGEYFGRELGVPCITNHWIGDGSKDSRIDKLGPRELLADAFDRIFDESIDERYNIDSVESKLFGVGVESYTPGSHEFYTNYVMSRKNCIICMDAGHYHPTEKIADKLSSYLCFNGRIMLHLSRPVRWDSDHVIMLDDDTKDIMCEIVRCNALDKVFIGTDYFDASIDRIMATVIGARNAKKALLYAFLQPDAELKRLESEGNFTGRFALLEEAKAMPMGAVWEEFCRRENVPGHRWIKDFMG